MSVELHVLRLWAPVLLTLVFIHVSPVTDGSGDSGLDSRDEGGACLRSSVSLVEDYLLLA